MPEEGLETHELREKLEEATEHAHGEGGNGHNHNHNHKTPWLVHLSLSTALIAVLAAIAALLSGSYANDAIVEKNDAVLHQSKASDEWAYFQAKGVKLGIYAAQADAIEATSPETAAKFREKARRYEEEQKEIEKRAREEEAKVEEQNHSAQHSLHIHHQFAKAVTVFQVAIALSAIGALTRKKAMWFVSLAVGLGGIFFFLQGFGIFGH